MGTPPTGSLPEKRERFAQEYVVDLERDPGGHPRRIQRADREERRAPAC